MRNLLQTTRKPSDDVHMIDEEISKVLELTNNGLSDREIADIMGFSRRTVGRRRAAGVTTQEEIITGEVIEDFPNVNDLALPEITGELPLFEDDLIDRFQPMELHGDAFITSDWHIPLHDPNLINKMFSRAKLSGNTGSLVINGDYWHMEAFSSFIPHQPEAALPVERWHGNVAMKNALEVFEDVYITLGNHDFRLVKKTGFKKSFEECMDWMFYALTDDERSRVHVTSLDYMYYYPEGVGGRKFRVCHPKNFSIVPLTVPRALAVRYGCSIITGHSHHCALGVAQDGYNLIIESGGFFNKWRTEYIQSTNRGHEWAQGWVEFTNGRPELIGPSFNNTH